MEMTKTSWRTRALSVVLSAALVVTLCPAVALADEPTADPETTASEPVAQADEAVTPPAGETTTPPAAEQTPGEGDANNTGGDANKPADETQKPAEKPKPAVKPKKPVVSFRTLGKIPGVSAKYQKKGSVTGKTASTKPLTYIKIKNDSKNIKGNITYKVRMANKGWTSWKKNGQKAGNGKTKNAVQALKIKLTGELGKQYNVFYRAYVVGYGWTGWGKNGEQVGAPKLANIRAYQVKIGPKKGSSAKQYNKKYNTKKARKNRQITSKTASEMSMRLSMAAKAQGQSSSTKWLILVDTHKNRVCVLKGKKGQWNVHKFFKCSCGAPGSRTVRGKFTIGSRGLSFGEDKGYSCWYWTQFYGNYLFHSVLYNPGSQRSLQDGRLGMNLSHGCVRLALGNAKWINRNIPSGTKVWTY
ncbi:L,D-transpeptidase family protein [Eggerthellaceae bacterium 24-137]